MLTGTETNRGAMEIGLTDAVLSGWFQNETHELLKGFQIGPDDIVLDVGCGDGGNTAFCARQGAHIVFTDVSPDCVAATARRLEGTAARSITGLVSTGDRLPLKDEFASRIVATEVIEHVDDPAFFLSELVRIGQRGALYLISAPDPAHENLIKPFANPVHWERPNHIRIVEHAEFSRLVAEAGLVIERQGQYGFYWSLWWAFFWICKVDFSNPNHPLLDLWSRTWTALLSTERGTEVKQALDSAFPKSQYIIARKP